VVEILKPLEGLPLKLIIRMCTDEREVSEYWHSINAALDLDIKVRCVFSMPNAASLPVI
jgi:hypothetical protein